MIGGNSEFGSVADTGVLHFANRIAQHGKETALPPRRRLEQAGEHLMDAVEELEAVLSALPSPDAAGADEVHEALGAIMETLRLLNDAHGRLETRATLRLVHGAE